MSRKELDRVSVIQRIENKEISQKAAALMLGRSSRQVRRWLVRYREEGEPGLISRRRGRTASNRLPTSVREQVALLIREHYADFGPTLAQEQLLERHDIKISVEALRQIMIQAGLWRAKRKRTKSIHPLRERRPCRGELIQIDGSPHAWFEGRGPRCNLTVFVDDATGELMALEFSPQETTEVYMSVLHRYLQLHGRPVSLYSDKHSIFRVNTETQEGKVHTQFGRAAEALGIDMIHASSPQAKGRVERMNRTLQDRLIKEMRLEAINGIEQANEFMTGFISRYNQRFSKPARIAFDAHRPVSEDATTLDLILSRHHQRIISKALEVRFKNTVYQLEKPNLRHRWANKKTTVCEHFDGRVSIQMDGQLVSYKTFSLGESPKTPEDAKTINKRVDQAVSKQKQRPGRGWRNFQYGAATRKQPEIR